MKAIANDRYMFWVLSSISSLIEARKLSCKKAQKALERWSEIYLFSSISHLVSPIWVKITLYSHSLYCRSRILPVPAGRDYWIDHPLAAGIFILAIGLIVLISSYAVSVFGWITVVGVVIAAFGIGCIVLLWFRDWPSLVSVNIGRPTYFRSAKYHILQLRPEKLGAP